MTSPASPGNTARRPSFSIARSAAQRSPWASRGTPEDRAYWIRKNQYYHDDLLELCEFLIPPDGSLLEVGCGTGELVGRLKRADKCGIDVSPEFISYASSHYTRTSFRVADAEDQTSLEAVLGDNVFDTIVLADTLSHAADVQTVLENMRPSLAPQGRMIVTIYNNLWAPLFYLAGKLGLRSPAQPLNWLDDTDLRNLIELAGFEVVSQGSRLIFPKRIPLLSSWVNRFLARLWPLSHLAVYHYYVLRAFPIPRSTERVSIVVPARNEAGTIEILLKSIPLFAPEIELIFVEGHSTDNTWDVLQNLPENPRPGLTVRVFQQEGKGKADAVHKGFQAATGDVLMILDADLSVDPGELARFYHALIEGRGDFINGSRLVYRLENDAMPFLNMLGNKLFGKIFSFLLGQPFKDTLCGTKVFWREDWRRIMDQRDYFGDFDPFGDFELLFGASKLNLKIISLPIHYKARIYGETNIRRFHHALILFRMCGIAARRLKFN